MTEDSFKVYCMSSYFFNYLITYIYIYIIKCILKQRKCREISGYIAKIDDKEENTNLAANRPYSGEYSLLRCYNIKLLKHRICIVVKFLMKLLHYIYANCPIL